MRTSFKSKGYSAVVMVITVLVLTFAGCGNPTTEQTENKGNETLPAPANLKAETSMNLSGNASTVYFFKVATANGSMSAPVSATTGP